MRLSEQGKRNLPELTNRYLSTLYGLFRLLCLEDVMLVGTIMEKVIILQGYFSWIFVSENQINPVVYVPRHFGRLQNFPHFENELLWIFGPARQLHIMDFLFILLDAQVNFVSVF